MATMMSKTVHMWHLKRSELYRHEKPYMVAFDVSGTNIKHTNQEYSEHEAVVTDVRGFEHDFAIDKHGFLFCRSTTKLTDSDFDSEKLVQDRYYPEVLACLESLFPAVYHLRVIAHTRRTTPDNFFTDLQQKPEFDSPVVFSHGDYTPSGIVHQLSEYVQERPDLHDRRIEVINVWRVTRGPNNDWPLAVCDYSTIDLNDVESTDVIHKERIGESLRLHHNRNQRWYYLSDQNTDEVTVFRNTDSRGMHVPFGVHLSFRNDVKSQARRSIEVRVACFF